MLDTCGTISDGLSWTLSQKEIYSWWAAVQLVGLIAFPIAFALFRWLPDRGYSFAKPLGLVLVGYIFWIGATAGLFPNSRGSVILVLILLSAVSLVVAGRYRSDLIQFLRQRSAYVLAVEVLFAVAFLTAAWLRSYVADITNTEKPMEFALLNSILRTEFFPGHDPWLAGHDINYYYFGYLITAIPIKLVGIPSSIGYNLGLVLVVAMSVLGGFGLLYNMVASRRSDTQARYGIDPVAALVGLLAVVLLYIFSNLEGILEILAAHGLGSTNFYEWAEIEGLEGPYESDSWYPTQFWFWWRATRVISAFTWSEFPFFSFLLGDFHPHVISIPYTLAVVGIAWNLLRSEDNVTAFWKHPFSFGLVALMLGGLAFMNTWNWPVLLSLIVVVVGIQAYWREGSLSPRLVVQLAGYAVALAVLSLVLYAPFLLTYDTPTMGLEPTRGPSTRPFHIFLMWGPFLAVLLSLALFAIARRRPGWLFPPAQVLAIAILAGLPLVAWAIVQSIIDAPVLWDDLPDRSRGWWTALGTVALLTVVMLALLRHIPAPGRRGHNQALVFALVLATLGLFLLFGPELFFVRDVLNMRVNTVFKSWYQSWFFLGVASVFGLYWILSTDWPRRLLSGVGMGVWIGAIALLFLGGFVYPVTATFNRTSAFERDQTLDGVDVVRYFHSAEQEAIDWIWDNIEGVPVILEAVGGSYTDFGRVSARTGLPTVLGWTGHERQWRAPSPEWDPGGTRTQDVERAYTTTSVEEARAIMEQYDVEYVYVGRLERETYGEAGLDKFASFMDVVYQNEGVIIYRLPQEGQIVVYAP